MLLGVRKWIHEEEEFLKRAFGEYSTTEIAEALDRSENSVEHKCRRLGLIKEDVYKAKEGYKVCRKCERELPREKFYKNATTSDGLQGWCHECQYQQQIENRLKNGKFQKEKEAILKAKEETAKEYKTCTKCRETKLGEEFGFLNKKLKRIAICKKCKVKQSKELESKRILNGKDW